jgi:hypothetical protein
MRAFLIAMTSAVMLLSPAAAQAPREGGVFQNELPARNKCVDIVQLENLPVKDDGKTTEIYSNNFQLVGNYLEIVGWLEGYFTAMNMYDSRTSGDITMSTHGREWMIWIFNYCKSNPWSWLPTASFELSKVLLSRRNGGSQ